MLVVLFGGMLLIYGHNRANLGVEIDSRVTQLLAQLRRRGTQADRLFSDFFSFAGAK